jgi:O-antigen ligase
MRKYPVLGAGPDHFPLVAAEFGWPKGKEAHSLWLQLGAEIGVPGALFLLLFYLAALWRLALLTRQRGATETDQWLRHAGCMVVTSLAGFVVSVQFVTMEGLETPLYVAAIAVATLRFDPRARLAQAAQSMAANAGLAGFRKPGQPLAFVNRRGPVGSVSLNPGTVGPVQAGRLRVDSRNR